MDKKTAAFFSLGCKVNQYEIEALAARFQERGYSIVDFSQEAGVYVINTCTVTGSSDRKSRQAIRRARRKNPAAVVVAMGCYTQLNPWEASRVPGVDLVLGTRHREQVPVLVEEVLAAREGAAGEGRALVKVGSLEGATFEEIPLGEARRTRAFIKIGDGCENHCSFCLVPYARGPVRSRRRDNIIQEARGLARGGAREIVLTGVNLGAYGRDFPGDYNLAGLIRELGEVPSLERVRLSSLEPTDFTLELIEAIVDNPKVCSHLHIPLQSGDNFLLKKMNRYYEVDEYRKLACCLKYLLPGLALTTDIMVGFPGEKEYNFQHTLDFVEEIGFSRLHVFQYSPRPGTPAAGLPGQVPPRQKEIRSQRLRSLGREMARDFSRGFIGHQVGVLLEAERGGGWLEGLTENYLKVRVPGDAARRGEIVPVKILALEEGYLEGVILG